MARRFREGRTHWRKNDDKSAVPSSVMSDLIRHPATARLRVKESFAINDLIALDPGSSPG
jgi:hypothetical protein